MKNFPSKLPYIIFFTSTLLFLFVFFTQINPIAIFEMDEWTHNTVTRRMLPQVGAWNPSRILPEITIPTVGSISAMIIAPLLQSDYITAQVTGHALFISAAIAFFISYVALFMKNTLEISTRNAISLSTIALILCLLIFKTKEAGNLSILTPDNIILFYFYTLPAMLCIGICLKLHALQLKPESGRFHGWLLLGIYLALFSNLFTSSILAAWSLASLRLSRTKSSFTKKKSTSFLVGNWKLILILAIWISSFALEATGGRSENFQNIDLIVNIKLSVKTLLKTFLATNTVAIAFLIIGVAKALTCAVSHKDILSKSLYQKLIITTILTTLFEVLLSARVDPKKLSSVHLSGIIMLMIFVTAIIGWSQILKKSAKATNLIPILIGVMIFEASPFNATTFQPINPPKINGLVAQNISRDIINQIVEAEKSGKEAIEVKIPKFTGSNNYPISTKISHHLESVILKHNITTRPIKITLLPDESMNKKHHIPID